MSEIKERIADYWSQRADAFYTQRIRELHSKKRERWLAEFDRYLPEKKPLRILDLGTGTGFFAFLLEQYGHETTGIDLTEEMILKAKDTANLYGSGSSFYVMDAEHPDFPEESFDALVTRNLTWTLPHLACAYTNWYKLLKPGGVLINFDADYYRDTPERQELPPQHAHCLIGDDMMDENDAITRAIGELGHARPHWDAKLLLDAGFEKITIDQGVYKRIYQEVDEFYNPTPIFTIAAYK